MSVIALPAVHFIPGSDLNGSYENVLDALWQIKNNTLLLVNCILYILSIAFFNYFGLSITRYLSVDGFACLIIGTLIYNKVMNLSFIRGCGDPPEDLLPVVDVTEQEVDQYLNEPSVADGDERPILSATGYNQSTRL
ncbi:unnamed protein product [Echinostoma caproni]|uniref:Golgi apparatus membrane protein TVP23 homolog n=1 Tax=Echinostoma caproni TaxID=27848 RepID=A0A183AVS9_9TREM|nr:unnamed protein product [Echinostoma caproni]